MTNRPLLRTILGLSLGLTLALWVRQPAHADEPPPTAEPPAAAIPAGYVATVLPNGLQVSILPVPEAVTVATQIFYHVGWVDEAKDEAGLSGRWRFQRTWGAGAVS